MSETRRKLRARAERRHYKDLPDEEIDDTPSFSLDEKLKCPRFGEINLIKEMKGEDLSFKYFQENGFEIPILVCQPKGLNMKVPNSKTFYVKDVENLVGPNRRLDVMDVKTQKNLEMTLKEWCDYFLNSSKKELLNVISLEFSHTSLAPHVEPPYVIKQLDWVNTVWPQFLKLQQKESTNAIEEMKYPKVQKYCLMSVKGCYTDFHIDFGGTSVWYHILRGKKVFWLIPPTPFNMDLYEQWVLSGKQSHLFFGDTVEHCSRITLYAGQTFFIPSGWIHAVFTPEDSLVFGGNFLFSGAIESQIKIYQLENATKVPVKFRYPFFNDLHWYVLSNYLECLTGKCYLTTSNDGTPLFDKTNQDDKKEHFTQSKWNLNEKDVYLEEYESNGLKILVKYLSKLPKSKQCVPSLIINSSALLNDAKQLITNLKKYDKVERMSQSSHPVLYWLCKINYESYYEKQAAKNDSSNFSHNLSPESTSTTNTLISPLKSWGSGLQNTVNTKFIAYKNKLNSETDDSKNKATCSSTGMGNSPKLNKPEIPNSFEKLIAATDISNKKSTTKTPTSSNLIVSSSNQPVNNVYLTHSNSSSIRPLPPNVVPATSMSIHYPTSSNLIMNRPTMFNTQSIVTSGMHGLHQTGIQPGSIICTNPANSLQPNLYAPIQQLQPGPMGIDSMSIRNNFNNYNLISNASMLSAPTGLSSLPVLTTDPLVMNNLTGNKFESQQTINNNKFGSSWLQSTATTQSQPSPSIKQSSSSNPITTVAGSSGINKLSKGNSKQSNRQQSSNLPLSQSSINHSTGLSTTTTIIPTQTYNPNTSTITSNITYTNTPHQTQHPFLSSPFQTAGSNKQAPVNNMFNLADPNRSNPVINFAGQPTGFIAPALNTNLTHPLNQNFIITPVTSNLIGNNLISTNQIYPNFISNVIPSNMLVNPALVPTIQQQAPPPIVIGKPTIKLQRINCRKCIPCNRNACGLCSPCLDYYSKFGQMPPANMSSFNGQTSSEICLAKKCLNPILPYAAVCCACGKNGWHNLVINSSDQQQIMQLESKCNLLECDRCNQIVHLDCVMANLPQSQKLNEGRMNNHLSNSWTCPVCVPIKDKEASAKLDSSLNKNKKQNQRSELGSDQHKNLQNANLIKNDNFDKSDKPIKKQFDLQQQKNKQMNKDQSISKSFNAKSMESPKTYSSNNDQSTKSGSRKEVYDFDDADDEIQTKFATSKFKKHEQKTEQNIKKTTTSGDNQQFPIKLPPKKMASKAKLSNHSEERNISKFSNYETEDKLLLLATTSCQKSPIEKLTSPSSKSQFERNRNLSSSSDKKISSKDQDEKINSVKQKSSTPSTSSLSSSNVQLNSNNKSKNKQMQSVRGRLEQHLKVLKKKSDSKNFNLSYRKFVTNQPVHTKTSSSTKLNISTNNASTTVQSNPNVQQTTANQLNSTTNSTNKESTVVSNCLKNDCILYPNSKDKDNKDALLNKFKNLSSTSIDTSFNKEDSSDSILGKLEIDTNLDSISDKNQKDKSPKTPSKIDKQKDNTSSLNSPSNKNLYECDTNSAKLLPMSYSIEKLASSTSINNPLEPAPISTFGTFDTTLTSELGDSKFGSKFKKQIDLFPNLNRYSSTFSNWSMAFKQNQETSSPSFNYSSTTPVFGAFSRTNTSTINTSNLFSSPIFGSSSSLNKDIQLEQPNQKKNISADTKRDSEKDYYTTTEDETEEPPKEHDKKQQINTDEDTDIQTDVEDGKLNEDLQRVINEQLMSDDEEEYQIVKKVTNKKGKTATGKESTGKKGKKATAPSKATKQQSQPSKSVKNNKTIAVKSNKKLKTLEKEAKKDDEQLTDVETEDEQIAEKIVFTKTKMKSIKNKQQATNKSKNRTSLNTTTSTTTTSKKGKQVKKTSPPIKSKQSKNKKNKSKASISASETKQRKSEVDRLLDQSSDSFNDFMFTDDVYETIADKVKRNLGRKSKIVAAAAVSALSLPTKQFENLISSTPTKSDKSKTVSSPAKKASPAAKNQSKATVIKKATVTKKQKANTSKDEETDIETEDELNDNESSFEETESIKKSTSRTNNSSNKKRKLKNSETTSPSPIKRKGRSRSKK